MTPTVLMYVGVFFMYHLVFITSSQNLMFFDTSHAVARWSDLINSTVLDHVACYYHSVLGFLVFIWVIMSNDPLLSLSLFFYPNQKMTDMKHNMCENHLWNLPEVADIFTKCFEITLEERMVHLYSSVEGTGGCCFFRKDIKRHL